VPVAELIDQRAEWHDQRGLPGHVSSEPCVLPVSKLISTVRERPANSASRS
jgi:hypothetical protein